MDGAYLKQRGRSWYVRVVVPKELQKQLGKREIFKALGTRCLSEGQRLRWPMVAQIQASFRQCGHVPDVEEALVNARALAALRDPEEREGLESAAGWVAEDMESKAGTAAAKRWYDVATGRGLPISEAVDRWLAERPTTQSRRLSSTVHQ
ncbi:MAG: hypothetical protein RIC54_05335 [Thalassobaculum sp.]|uniref:DUF6538 domain-containing protein n=1 Tax=Thalassobaculum sp. TaxID=2022740 RepID=UPI0032EFB26D